MEYIEEDEKTQYSPPVCDVWQVWGFSVRTDGVLGGADSVETGPAEDESEVVVGENWTVRFALLVA